MVIKNWKKEIFTIPNMLSIFRLLLIPLYVSIYLNAQTIGQYYLAAAILAVSCLTDLIDGQIARRFNMGSTLGQLLDPLADKVTQITLLVCLAIHHPILWIMIGLLAVKELYQLIICYVFYRKGKILRGAQITGKISTTVLFISLILLVMMPNIPDVYVTWITWIDIVFLSIAFVDYIVVYIRQGDEFRAP